MKTKRMGGYGYRGYRCVGDNMQYRRGRRCDIGGVAFGARRWCDSGIQHAARRGKGEVRPSGALQVYRGGNAADRSVVSVYCRRSDVRIVAAARRFCGRYRRRCRFCRRVLQHGRQIQEEIVR